MIILIGGGICEGKDTTAALIVRNIEISNSNADNYSTLPLHSLATHQGFWHKRANIHGWNVDRFAFMPKLHCSQILGIDYSEFNVHSSPNKRKYREYYARHAQILKQVYGDDVWAQALMNKYRGRNLIVCDWRYSEEIDAIERSGNEYRAIILERKLTANMWAQSLGFVLGEGEYDRFITKSEFIRLIEGIGIWKTNKAMYLRIVREQADLSEIMTKYSNIKIIENKGLDDLSDSIQDFLVEEGII